MVTQANSIVILWFFPVLLHIILPLAILAGWILLKPMLAFQKREKAAGKKEVRDTAMSATRG